LALLEVNSICENQPKQHEEGDEIDDKEKAKKCANLLYCYLTGLGLRIVKG
jgi:hypothetical protein